MGFATHIGFLIAVLLGLIAGIVWMSPVHAEIATWYGAENGSETSSGERFNPDGFCAEYAQHSCTCAHRGHPFNTYLRVRWNHRSVVCRVNDRGPNAATGADIDLSRSAARVLRMIVAGRVPVSIVKLERFE